MKFTDALPEDISDIVTASQTAFLAYRKLPLQRRVGFMHKIAELLEEDADRLIESAARETHLPEARLRSELVRTKWQLTSYADAAAKGEHLQVRIDPANAATVPPQPDIRKMMVPLGPVAVFGAANFPFAYSTAGGDTASALAAGCTVIVKAHPAHAETSQLVADCIEQAALATEMPVGTFQHLHGSSHEVGRALIEHPLLKAVGFTGSLAGGRQLFDWAMARPAPIPVFAEMSSINPIFLMPEKLQTEPEELARMIAASITLGVGQFCTNPGLLIAPKMPALTRFRQTLAEAIEKDIPAEMLHTGIFQNYVERRANTLAQAEVELLSNASTEPLYNQGVATIAATSAQQFLNNPLLHQEVFGPFSLLIECEDMQEMLLVAQHIEGQLTATLMATDGDLQRYPLFLETAIDMAGRVIRNGVPTGVAVCQSQMHGGPYPATTDSRFTAVGADALLRFLRPLAFQNWTAPWLPEPLRG